MLTSLQKATLKPYNSIIFNTFYFQKYTLFSSLIYHPCLAAYLKGSLTRKMKMEKRLFLNIKINNKQKKEATLQNQFSFSS